MNKMNTLTFVNFLLVKLYSTLIRQNFPPSKICAVRYPLNYLNCDIKFKHWLIIDIAKVQVANNRS